MASFPSARTSARACVLGLALSAAQLLACASPTRCEEHGGVTVHGVCICPDGTTPDGDSCHPSSSPVGQGAEHGRDVDAARAAQHADGAVEAGHPGARDASAPDAKVSDTQVGHAPLADASAPSTIPLAADAATGTAHADAGLTVTPPTPDPVMSADGTCAPMGDWTFERSFTGSCPAGASEFVSTFHGKLEDPYVADDTCITLWALTSGDCVLSYTQSCTLGGGVNETVMGSLTMTSATTMSGSATITGGRPGCSSQVSVSATKN